MAPGVDHDDVCIHSLVVILLTRVIYSIYISITYFTKYSILINVLEFVSSDSINC